MYNFINNVYMHQILKLKNNLFFVVEPAFLLAKIEDYKHYVGWAVTGLL